jgi:outer membrane protein assembly factor BamB
VAPGPTGDKKTVFVRDSRERVLRLDRSRVAGGGWEVRGEAIWNQGVNQELVVIPGEDGTARVVVRGFEEIHPILAALAPDGTLFWQVQPGATAGVSRNEAMPIGINVGRDQTTGETRLIFAAGTSNQFPQTLQAIDATSGRNLWRSDTGTYWDGVVTCWDVDGDGIDDAIVNWNTLKCIVVNGRTGETLAEGTRLPPFRELGEVNYNGVPIVASGHEGRIEIVNSEDDAHLAGLTLHGSSAAGASCEAEVRWSLEQSVIDDERRSMSALAPDPRWGWIVGTGSRRGVMRAVRGDTGQEIWRVALWNGNAKPEDGDHPENPLSAVLAMDVNGDGRTDFVVGGGDGWLYTIDSGSGRLVWSLDLKAPVLNPIAADFDGVGSSEILVPTGDGYLHAIGGR